MKKLSKGRVRQLLFNLYSRHMKAFKTENNIVIPKKRTWQSCYRCNRNKLYFRVVTLPNRAKKKTSMLMQRWKPIISFQKQKLYRLYSTLNRWSLKEYDMLERMNNNLFHRNLAPNIVWRHIAIKQVSKINRNLRKEIKPVIITDRTWPSKIRLNQYKIENQYHKKLIADETLFEINIKENRKKLNTIHVKKMWETRIYDIYRMFVYHLKS